MMPEIQPPRYLFHHESYHQYFQETHEAGALDAKTKELMHLALVLAFHCEPTGVPLRRCEEDGSHGRRDPRDCPDGRIGRGGRGIGHGRPRPASCRRPPLLVEAAARPGAVSLVQGQRQPTSDRCRPSRRVGRCGRAPYGEV